MTNQITHQTDGIDFLCPVAFDLASGVATLIGGLVAVDAINAATKIKTPGTATVISSATIHCTFAPWSLTPGIYSVQVRAKPLGFTERTVVDETFWVVRSAAATPG